MSIFSKSLMSAIAVCLICAGCSSSPLNAKPIDEIGGLDKSVPDSIYACFYSWGSEGATERHFVVSMERKKLVYRKVFLTPEGEKVQCKHPLLANKKRSAEIYKQLVAKILKGGGSTHFDAELVDVLQRLEKYGKDHVERYVIVSPDERSAVIKRYFFNRLIVVDLKSLKSYPLDDYAGKAIRWSPDSRYLAYAAHGEGIHIYSMEKHSVVRSFPKAGTWIVAITWSADRQRVALLGLENRRMNYSPIGLFLAGAGHPEFWNDLYLRVFSLDNKKGLAVELEHKISEWGGVNDPYLEWR